MKTIGQYLREQRKQKGMSFEDLSAKTRIRKEFLVAIEKENWDKLPEFSVVSGFVKNMADAIGMNRDQAVAILRRDYPPKANTPINVNPKPEVPREFRLSPQLTFLFGVGAVIVSIIIYLVFQYFNFMRAPMLSVSAPVENALVLSTDLAVSGKTDPNTTVIVNTQPALVDEEGNFTTIIEITSNTQVVEVKARSRAGKETVITRTIQTELEN